MTDVDGLVQIDRRLVGYDSYSPENGTADGPIQFLSALVFDLAGAAGHMAAVEDARRNHAAAEGVEL